jgi:hypothetical protein
VYDFWLSPGISHPTGNKSDIKRERLGPNIYASHMAQVIEETQTDAYIDFVAKYPDIKIGQRTFDKLNPFFVRPASEKDRNTCCCRYHTESNRKINRKLMRLNHIPFMKIWGKLLM